MPITLAGDIQAMLMSVNAKNVLAARLAKNELELYARIKRKINKGGDSKQSHGYDSDDKVISHARQM